MAKHGTAAPSCRARYDVLELARAAAVTLAADHHRRRRARRRHRAALQRADRAHPPRTRRRQFRSASVSSDNEYQLARRER
eukprot:1276582-Pleurochrysis_carterae.AAC.1